MVSVAGLLSVTPVFAIDAIVPITASGQGSEGVALIQDSVTEVFTAATIYVTGNETFNIVGPTTLVITNCPCTVTSTFMEAPTGIQTAMDAAPTLQASANSTSEESKSRAHSAHKSSSDSGGLTAVSTNGAARLLPW